jgi:hypothetical protein
LRIAVNEESQFKRPAQGSQGLAQLMEEDARRIISL